jgi:hypothetical protein
MGLRRASVIDSYQADLGREIAGAFSDATPELVSGITGTGETRADVIRDFQDYVSPVMDIFNKDIAPLVSEGFNLPGAFHSRARSEGLRRAGEDFLSTRVTPQLFTALENFRNREISRANVFASALGIGSSLSTTPTFQAFNMNTRDWQAKIRDIQQTVSGYVDTGQSLYNQFS